MRDRWSTAVFGEYERRELVGCWEARCRWMVIAQPLVCSGGWSYTLITIHTRNVPLNMIYLDVLIDIDVHLVYAYDSEHDVGMSSV